jgi:hypothetical protein
MIQSKCEKDFGVAIDDYSLDVQKEGEGLVAGSPYWSTFVLHL